MTAWSADQILRAGGTAPTSTANSTPLQARSWQHPATGDLTLVRLVRTELAEAEDLAMDAIGFTVTGHTPVGHTSRRALGFPEWALINDPANAEHALAMVGDLDRVRRLARTRPKDAKALADSLVARLEKAEPSYLPTLCEEVGRAFLAVDNRSWAGQWFNKAREAERTYRLPIDEQRHQAVFLEFAYAQALPVKAIAAEAKEIGDRLDPQTAHETFRQFVIDRVRGGLAPYSAMTKDVEGVARAAGVDPTQATREILELVLEQPSVTSAPTGWWKSVSKPLTSLIADDLEVAVRLGTLQPTQGVEAWAQLLTQCGLPKRLGEFSREQLLAMLESLVALANTHVYESLGRPDRLIRLVGQVLTALGPVTDHQLPAMQVRAILLDLIDVLCAHGFDIAASGPWHPTLNLEDWHQHPDRRDLEAAVQVDWLQPLLWEAMVNSAWEHVDSGGLRAVAQPKVDQIVRALADHPTLVEVEDALDFFGFLAPQFDELAAAFQSVDLTAATRQTLRSGMRAELEWPAFSQAQEDGFKALTGDFWPKLIMEHREQDDAVLVDSDQYTALSTPGPSRPWERAWIASESDIARAWQTYDESPEGVWLSDPTNIQQWQDRQDWPYGINETQASLGNGMGGRVFGTGLVRYPGDRDCASVRGTVWSDGQRMWTWHSHGTEIDPKTAAPDRDAVPGFLADAEAELGPLAIRACHYRPVPEGLPVHDGWINGGTDDHGQLGIAIAPLADGGALIRTVTEKRIEAAAPRLPYDLGPVYGLMRLPGSDEQVVVRQKGTTDLDGRVLVSSRDFSGFDEDRETPTIPWMQAYDDVPWAWAVHLRPTDLQVSQRLRQATVDQAAALIAADGPDTDADSTEAEDAAIEALIGHADEDSLVALVVLGVGRIANRLKRRIGALDAGPSPEDLRDLPGLAAGLDRLGHYGYQASLRDLVARQLAHHDRDEINSADIDQAFGALAALLRGDDAQIVTNLRGTLWSVLTEPTAWLYVAALVDTPDEERDALLTMVRAALRHGLIADDVHLIECEPIDDDKAPLRVGDRFELPSPTVIVNVLSGWGEHNYVAVQRGERLGAPPNTTVSTEHPAGGIRDPQRLGQLLANIEAGARITWDVAAIGTLAELADVAAGQAAALHGGLVLDRDASFDTATAKSLGLKPTEAKRALGGLKDGVEKYRRVLAAGMSGWSDGRPDLEAMAQVWQGERATQVVLPEALAERFHQEFRYVGPPLLEWLVDPDKEVDYGSALKALLWLQYELPAGPLRDNIVSPTWRRFSDTVTNSPFGYRQYWHDPDIDEAAEALGITRETTTGPFRLEPAHDHDGFELMVYPDLLTDEDADRLARFKVMGNVHTPTYDVWLHRAVIARITEQSRSTADHGLADGAELRDPRVSVPDLVATVAADLGVGEDSAALFLMILALPDPTTKNIRAWTGWSTKQITAAAQPLVAADVLVEAKRARAGRNYFLHGPWVNSQSPALPIEEWKSTTFGMNGKWPNQLGIQVILPLEPVPLLFANAWQRWVDGDRPGHAGFTSD